MPYKFLYEANPVFHLTSSTPVSLTKEGNFGRISQRKGYHVKLKFNIKKHNNVFQR